MRMKRNKLICIKCEKDLLQTKFLVMMRNDILNINLYICEECYKDYEKKIRDEKIQY